MSHRPRLILDGLWEFWKDPDSSLSHQTLLVEENAKPIFVNVPSAWQSQSVELRYYSGAAWYRREVKIPDHWLPGYSVILGIDAADYFTEVWLNEIKVGEHEGGYLPFEFDVTHAIRPGANNLTIRVDDPPSLFHEIPHGKQGWYGPLSGIWQSVWLEKRSLNHIKSLNLSADLNSGWVQIEIALFHPETDGCQVTGRIFSPQGEIVATLTVPDVPGSSRQQLALQVIDPCPWSPDQPDLYTLEVELLEDDRLIDSLSKHFGFRTIEARDGQLFLNGQLLYLRGALDQDYYPETIVSPPTEKFLEDQLLKAKAMGLNCLRCHIKAADPRYYEVADRLGMLIWTELPNWSVFTERAGTRGRKTLEGIVSRDGHHPSIIAWTIINENWGMDLVNDPAHQAWLVDTYQWLKNLDPTRLVIDNSPCEPNFHIQTDVEDYHFYRAIPDHRKEWDQFVRSFASRAPWTFSPNGLHVRTGKEPLVVSEFGNWGLPDINLLLDEKGQDPWWYETGFEWGEGVVYPQGIRSRFRNLGLDRVFGSWRGLVEATQWQQYDALKYQIEAMRRTPEIAGYVITELTDVHWECNGLLDMCRNPKIFFEQFNQLNANTVIIPDWERVSYWVGEIVQVGVRISHGAGTSISGAQLLWWLEQENEAGWIEVPGLEAGQVKLLGDIQFLAPEVETPQRRVLKIELRDSRGSLLASNHLDLTIFPHREVGSHIPGIKVHTEIRALADCLHSLGYSLAADPETADLIIAPQTGDRLLSYIQAGGRALILADRAVVDGYIMPGIYRHARHGTPWAGDWASSFSWINRQGVFTRFPGGPLLDFSFDHVIPQFVLTGFREWEFSNLVRAGIIVGWIHRPAALIGERYYGSGKAVVNTFNLSEADLGIDPVATNLLDTLIELTLK
jgi:hypothetical protein